MILFAGVLFVASAAAGTIEDDLADFLREAYALPDAELAVSLQLDAPVPLELQPYGDRVRFTELMLDRASGRFAVTALLPQDSPTARIALSGQVTALVDVPVLRDMVRRGQLVTQEIVAYQLVPAYRLSGGMVVDVADLVGQAARRTLHAGRPIRSADLMPPIVVAKNKVVRMVYEVGALRLTARGRALGDGGAGTMIKVLNIDSKRSVDAIVIDNDTVAVIRGEQP
ncbi:MAG: flagellar basal body P-ring formation chaperone FlgA [Dongiaceae bacterium]